MDEIDKKINQILEVNGGLHIRNRKSRQAFRGAVRKRIKDLVSSGIIKRFTLKLSLSEGAEAIALISINPLIPHI